MLAMIGTIMIVRISAAVNIPVPVDDGGPKIGRNPRVVVQPGLEMVRQVRAEHEDPQRPSTTLGIAAQHLDQRSDDATHAAGCELAQPERDGDRKRGGDQEAPGTSVTTVP